MLNRTHFSQSSKFSQDLGVTETTKDLTVESWMQSRVVPQSDRTLSPNQRTSLSALVTYIAHQSGENEFGVERRLADHFNIANVMCLPADEYDDAIRYLVDCI